MMGVSPAGAVTGPRIKVMKSVFFATVVPVTGSDTARSVVKEMKQRDRKARHIVFAFRIGGNPVTEGMSDDGEPRGTGGLPILQLLRKEERTDVLVAVTRYWGGVKLGPGNLMRAYLDAAKQALESVSRG
jgi:putative IMPACT (imprinted ancient) family translation regulator